MEQKGLAKVEHSLRILEHIEETPDTTQANIATQIELAVGTVNWYLKRFITKGYVKIKQLQGRRVRYLITPKGITEKARLTASYLQVSMRLYRETREKARQLLVQVRRMGYDRVRIEGDGDLADICRLTCLEQGVKVEQGEAESPLPVIQVDGMSLSLAWPENSGPSTQPQIESTQKGVLR